MKYIQARKLAEIKKFEEEVKKINLYEYVHQYK